MMTRPSNPALYALTAALQEHHDDLLAQWLEWITERVAQAPHVSRPTLQRHLALLIGLIIELSGPLRRQVTELWFTACEAYGQTAAARGLAAGEVVEELQQLRELLIRMLSETVALMSPRQSMTAVLRLNRTVDRGVAHAVVGYTDALVETLLNGRGVPIVATQPGEDEVLQRLAHLENELEQLRRQNR
jgi:hypothetical protein